MITFVSPTYIEIPRKTKKNKRVPLNLNWYRNAQHFESNKVKQLYNNYMLNSLMLGQFGDDFSIFESNTVYLDFQLYRGTKRKCDRSNVTCIVEKFFCDWLVEVGFIKDDSQEYIGQVIYEPYIYKKGRDECVITVR